MAGIGFELKKVINEKSVSSFLKASVSGIFIVAGPWILSIVSLGLISFIAKETSNELLDQFFGILVYIYSFSLILSGGIQYLFTRIFADFIYENRIRESLYIILIYLILTGILSLFISGIITGNIIGWNIKLLLSISLQASVVNMLWIILIFISFLKWYIKILISYFSGIAISTLILLLVGINSIQQLLLIYTIGNSITLLFLTVLSVRKFHPKTLSKEYIITIIIKYSSRYRFLIFIGIFYYLSFWSDKILYWIHYGEVVDPLNIKLFFDYDISMYIANLSIIPGMVYFVINSETSFYIKMKKFLISLNYSDYKTINIRKKELGQSAASDIKRQSLVQSYITLILILLSSYLLPSNIVTLIAALSAAFTQLILFTYLNFLFYMERYVSGFLVVLFSTLLNILLFYIYHFLPIINIPGISYFFSVLGGTLLAYYLFQYDLIRLDRYVYSQNNR